MEGREGTGRGGATLARGAGLAAVPGDVHCACADRRKMADSAELKVKRSSNSLLIFVHGDCAAGARGDASDPGGPLGPDSNRAWSCREERRAGPQPRGPGSGGPRAPGASGALTGRPQRVIVVGASGGGGGGRDRESGGGGRGCPRGLASSPSRQPPCPPWGAGAGAGCSCWGDWESSPPPLPLPPLQSRAPVRRSPQTPGNLAPAAPPLRAPCRPRPGLGSPRLPACQEAPGVPRLWAARSWGDGVGMWGRSSSKV